MVICESYMFDFSVIKDMGKKHNDNKGIPTYIVAYFFDTNYQGIEN